MFIQFNILPASFAPYARTLVFLRRGKGCQINEAPEVYITLIMLRRYEGAKLNTPQDNEHFTESSLQPRTATTENRRPGSDVRT